MQSLTRELRDEFLRRAGHIRILRVIVSTIELRMSLLVLLMVAILSKLSPYFLTINNILNLMDQVVVVGILSLGMTIVILIGGIDLSVGSLVGITGVVLGLSFGYIGLMGAITLSVLTGAIFGFINGAIITYGRIAAFVVTLGMMSVGRSLAYVMSDAHSINNIPESLAIFSAGIFYGVPVNFVILLSAYAVGWWFLTYSKGGRTLFAIGSNREAANVAGLRTTFWGIVPYVVTGITSAVAAVFLASRLLSIDPVGGTGLELDAIAAVVIGGASLFGGRGSLMGTLAGVLIMVFIRNALNLLNISPYWQGTAIGAILVAAVLVESVLSGRARH
jgi:ribose transport system permease protein